MNATHDRAIDETSARYEGWRIVAVCFLVATFGWGLGFYGQSVYVAELHRSASFALVLFAQVGFIVHLIAFLDSVMGRERAAFAVALMTAMAVVGRVLFSTVIDRLNQRPASAISFVSQAMALAVIINVHDDIALIAACALFGFSVGNLITLPALIVQREFDPRSFGVLISLITAINQVTYAFGPGVIGLLRDASGSYSLPFYGCIGLELTAAVLIMIRGRGRARASS